MINETMRRQLREQLRDRVDARGLAIAPRTERRLRVREEALALLRASGAILPQRELAHMVNEVSDEVVGFGPIEFLLKDPTVTEVMVNGPDDVYVEREGRIERAPDGLFEGEEAVLHLMGWGGGAPGCAVTRTSDRDVSALAAQHTGILSPVGRPRLRKEIASMENQDDRKGTVEVRLRFWRNRDPSGKGGHRGSGEYLPDGLVWPAGTVYVPEQPHASSTAERKVNHPFEWMEAIRDALADAGIKMVPPDFRE